MKNGGYLISKLPDNIAYIICVCSNERIIAHKITKKQNDAVVLENSNYENREFNSLEELILFCKSDNTAKKVGMATKLTDCLPPM